MSEVNGIACRCDVCISIAALLPFYSYHCLKRRKGKPAIKPRIAFPEQRSSLARADAGRICIFPFAGGIAASWNLANAIYCLGRVMPLDYLGR